LSRSLRSLIILGISLVFVAMICFGLVFLLAGEDIRDFVRVAPARLNVFLNQDALDASIGSDNTPIRFLVSQGETPPTIAINLINANLISDPELFVDYVRSRGIDIDLEAGIYFLSQTQTLREIALSLTDSNTNQITFTVFPGWRLEQVIEAVDTNSLFGFSGSEFANVVEQGVQVDPNFVEFIDLPVGASLEGFLFPDTYSLPPDISPIGLRTVLLEAFQMAIEPQLIADAQAQDLSLYDVITLASIVQREALFDDEKPLIAGVYRNRLAIDMRLDADPTVQYPLGIAGDWWPRITFADYQGTISEYNTYRRTGLPPGPIAIPDMSAIRAVIYPEESEFFFFRADCRTDGYHDFATTFEQHLANGC